LRTEEFIKLLAEPYTVEDFEVDDLRELAAQYPYSQVIQLLYGLRLRYSSAHLFNQQLGRAAALSNDRSVLFELFEGKQKAVSRPAPLSVVSEPEEVKKEEKSVKSEAEELIATDSEPNLEADDSKDKESIAVPEEEAPSPELSHKEDTVVEETISPQIDKPEESEVPAEEKLGAVPEDLSDLSPQERVKAILARNKAIREQFEQERKGMGEKLFAKGEGAADSDESNTDSETADSPIDIAALVERREAQMQGSSEVEAEDPSTEAEEPEVEATEQTETEASNQEEFEEKVEAVEENELVDKEDQGDLALSARIRIIRDRLEALKASNALSEEEMQTLMEEHSRLESLMSDLPIDEEHVFDVELEAESSEADEASMEFEIDELENETEEATEPAADNLDAEIERIEGLAAQLRQEAPEEAKTEHEETIPEALEGEPESSESAEAEQSIEEEPVNAEELNADLEVLPEADDSQAPVLEEELSFSDWLRKLRDGEVDAEQGPRHEIKAKVDLLDSFVDKLPELKMKSRLGGSEASPSVNNPSPSREESEGLGMVTETLAKVYIRQKHYKKAIQAYEILKLKYPEKSTFFASQILEIKKLAKSN